MDRECTFAPPPDRIDTDELVIGTGPGGAVAAALLAERGRDVVAIDEGPFVPLETCVPFSRDETERKYRGGGLTVTLGSRIVYAEGRCVGGGSEINSGLYHRTPADVLERWTRDHGLAAAREADLAPHFEAIEADLGVATPPAHLPGPSVKLAAGAAALGWRSVEVPRVADAPPASGGAPPPGGGRRSMTRTLLPRALRAGARLVPETRAWRLRREAGRWRVTARHGAGAGRWRPVEIVAERVWLAAGAVHTPALLQRSGWPRTAGSTLRLQTMVRVVASFPDAINEPTQVAAHQVREFAPRWTLGCSISTPPNLAMAMLDHPDRLCAIRSEWPRMAIFYGLVRGGMGRVWALPGLAEPLVTYRLRTQDHRDLAEALAGLSRLLLHAGAEEILPGVGACARIRDADGLRRLPETLAGRRATLLSLHLLGSCATGGRSGSLADSFGRIRCANGLHLADASLLPDAPGVNPQGTIMAFARRNVLAALDDSAPTSTR